MELEMKILREKVRHDEKNTGIGSLYDDEKTSHQHIQLLKTKYAKMKRDFDREFEALSKKQLNVVGDGYILKAQVDTMRSNNAKLSTNAKEFDGDFRKKQFDLEKEVKEMQRVHNELDAEIRSL